MSLNDRQLARIRRHRGRNLARSADVADWTHALRPHRRPGDRRQASAAGNAGDLAVDGSQRELEQAQRETRIGRRLTGARGVCQLDRPGKDRPGALLVAEQRDDGTLLSESQPTMNGASPCSLWLTSSSRGEERKLEAAGAGFDLDKHVQVRTAPEPLPYLSAAFNIS